MVQSLSRMELCKDVHLEYRYIFHGKNTGTLRKICQNPLHDKLNSFSHLKMYT